ncbi:MAG: ribonuclease III [Clostridia bacterium]|nr:ribonuclease III [Clostridia bacterium]
MTELTKLEEILGYSFKNKQLLEHALTHSSYANERRNKEQSNERLEFLGDSVLSMVISRFLFDNCPGENEGSMSKNRAYIVCETSLARVARKLSLGNYLYLGNGEDKGGGRERDSILSDAVDAVIAAMYLDGGMEITEKWILKALSPVIAEAAQSRMTDDFKTLLQEKYQANGKSGIEYEVIGEEGPAHNKCFTVSVKVEGDVLGTGKGRSKKAAEQAAAREALKI